MFSRIATISILAAAFEPSIAVFVDYNFNIQNVNAAPDGFQRSVVSVNNQLPGTLIKANKGDTLRINVTNSVLNLTSFFKQPTHMPKCVAYGPINASSNYNPLAWAGMPQYPLSSLTGTKTSQFQATTADEDVTQCPISQNQSYTYEIPLHDQTGTFWYHSHLASQYVDGLRGPRLALDPNDPQKNLYDVDDESTIVVLEDWYHTPAPALEAQMFSSSNTQLLSPVPDSALINGKGRYVGGPAVQRSRINVTPGKKYRLRVINASAIGSYTFSIEGHNMTIIEADGIAHEPHEVGSFQIFAGQRYSVIVHANQAVANYWIRSPITVAGAGTNPNLDPTDVFAVLHYDGAPDAEPTTEQGTASGLALLESDLHALENPGAPGGSAPPDVNINLVIGRSTVNGIVQFTFNGIKYKSPDLPTLLKILANNATNDADFSQSEHTIVLPHNKVIQLNITGGADHPIHLHGHVFDVVKSLGQTTPNYVNPPRRDVVRVSNTGVLLRFRTDNPGPWFVHCHIDWHLEAGLAVVFAESPDEIRQGAQSVQPNAAWNQLCPKYQALPADLQ
ncbi:Multicopper oxidase [Ceratobasidium sp. AG-Ba]|nr:Multicopper oxidase [Ceratobasidium sp. AG-Ba]